LPAPIVNSGGDKLLKMEGFPTLKGLWPLPCIGSYCILSCITHHQIPLQSKKRFVDGRKYVRIDVHLRVDPLY